MGHSISPSNIKQQFTEFASLDDAYIQLYINTAALTASSEFFGTSYVNNAVSYLTAHLLKLSATNGGSSSELKREKVGELEREYAVPKESTTDSIYSTRYGKEYMRFKNMFRFRTMPIVIR